LVATAARNSSNIYVKSKIGNEKCCLRKEDEILLWHRSKCEVTCRVFDNLVKCYNKREEQSWEIFAPRSRNQPILYARISSKRKAYKCYNLRLNKVVKSINVKIDETDRLESKKEENKSMEQLFEEEGEK
jgi:hypothetical protein